jgi:hypothetical protein
MAAKTEAAKPEPKIAGQAFQPTRDGCHNCAHWLARPHLAVDGRGGAGECRRNPPMAAGMRSSQFPMTRGQDWCGEQKLAG